VQHTIHFFAAPGIVPPLIELANQIPSTEIQSPDTQSRYRGGMLLSFVVPAYNEEAYLGACLESILDQTRGLEHLTEIIVVNNASTDHTREIALSYPRVRLVDELRKGLPYARQAGFLASTGSLIANVDADSRLTPGWVEKVLTTFRDHEAIEGRSTPLVSLSGPLVYYDLTSRQRRLVNVFYMIAWLTYATNKYILRVGSMVQGGNFVLSRAALEAIGGYDTSITFYGEDTDIARRLHAVGKVLFTFDLKMLSSARRLKHEGMLTIAFRYGLNYFWTTFFKRPFTREHIDIREPELNQQFEG
jgi:glycosyltransferase involved in cell wall biosynthesis